MTASNYGKTYSALMSRAFVRSDNNKATSTRLLNEERGQTGGNECDSPNRVEVEPRLTKKGEAELAIDYPRDNTGDRKIRCRVDCGGEYPGERASGGSHAIVTCHLVCRFDRAAAQQHRRTHLGCRCPTRQ